ncbi:glycerophosphodiester phosphodiesterase GDPD4-like isoform X5 [Glycine soja]|uniref:PI-PLC-like phosphodiesterase domain-contiaing protein isoform X9 n=1 Tax=Glycine max TaxID=3847 RepID=UPI0007191424|nr:PI-PLC-like phosphodiesterase domain-contiaing protein isoform X9 [Glycine max]XP_028238511.1 glycerophosphodiester phosphodiesterase GDPD4-like isoform X5 [Glycine soja]|eukprot:XP_014631644.1 PI-PLC-like phosphodiesterase domain-contiaing protein isoform X7 [Glycine max]
MMQSSRSRKAALRVRVPSRKLMILSLAIFAILPPIFFHFRLRRLQQLQFTKCRWLNDPPLVCAHGGDSSKASPNTMASYFHALQSRVDCIEIDVSRSSDGVLFALHDRDLQRLTGSATSKVGYLNSKEVEKTECSNCLIWAKSDILARDVIKLSSEITVGYIVMREPSTGARTNLLRMKGAEVVGVYHPLIDENLVKVLHRRNKKVYAWTVDDVESMQKVLFEHVDAIVTSNPTFLQRLMQDIKTQCLEEGYSLPR